METLHTAGYEQYEVSNFARPGFRSEHNWGYWHGASYVGVGLSAHSFIDGRRSWNTPDLQEYIAAIEAQTSPCRGQEIIDATKARRERFWLRLRTCAGVRLDETEWHVLQKDAKCQAMVADGLVRLEASRLRLTPQGFPLADGIGVALVDILESVVSGSPVRCET